MIFSYQIEEKEGIVLLYLSGNVLEELEETILYEKINALLENGARALVVDLSKITHINSSGLNLLIRLLTKCRNSNGEMILCSLPDNVQNLLIITKLTSIFEIAKDVDAAMERLAQNTL